MRAGFAALALVLSLAVATAGALAQDVGERLGDDDVPFLLSADEVIYDNELEIVTATGNVEISQNDRVLLADTINYNLRDGIVTASGNISLLEPSGDVLFAEYLELDDELTSGFVRSIRVLMTDQSRFAANGARRFPDERTEMSKAVYSPCALCPDNPDRPPLWQLKAVKIIHDRKEQTVRYQDAFLELYGIPVAYTPFFQHTDPTVKRKSGFLAPEVGSDSDLGFTLRVPYYFNLAPNRDATFSPLFTSDEGVVLAGEYRARTESGQYQLAGSATYVKKRDDDNNELDDREIRGHIVGDGRFDIDDTWRWGFDVSRATDDTYLSRYNISSDDTLTSDLFVEGFRGRNFASASGFAFQGLEVDDDPDDTPLVLPLLEYSYVGLPSARGDRFGLDLNLVSLYRTGGTDTRRASARGHWELPYIGPAGDVYRLTAALWGDAYWVNDVDNVNVQDDPTDSGFEGRFLPQLALEWRYPFVRTQGTVRQYVEPIVQAIAAPYGSNPSGIRNEDSLSLEFDDTNLFSLNRFPGYDRVETGPRINYGVKASAYGESGGYATALLGQVLRFKDDDTFAEETGLDDRRSDYVAAISIVPSDFLDFTNRVRLDRDDLTLRRNEIYASVGPKWLRLTTSYVQLDRELTADELGAREEIFVSGRAQLNEYWSATAQTRRDLTDDGGTIRTTFGLEYLDECIGFDLIFDRNFTRDRDVEPSTSVKFRVRLRHLG